MNKGRQSGSDGRTGGATGGYEEARRDKTEDAEISNLFMNKTTSSFTANQFQQACVIK